MTALQDYLQALTPLQQAEFERIRTIVKRAVPDAEELISYGVPTFKYNKRPLLYFGAYPGHLSLYPTGDDMIAAIPELAASRTGKGTLQYSIDNPLSDELVAAIVAFRLKSLQ